MEQLFKAKDGTIFNSEKECKEHELKLADKEKSRKEMHEQVEKAKQDYLDKCKQAKEAYNNYTKALSEFNKKFGAYHTKITTADDFRLFDLFDWFGML